MSTVQPNSLFRISAPSHSNITVTLAQDKCHNINTNKGIKFMPKPQKHKKYRFSSIQLQNLCFLCYFLQTLWTAALRFTFSAGWYGQKWIYHMQQQKISWTMQTKGRSTDLNTLPVDNGAVHLQYSSLDGVWRRQHCQANVDDIGTLGIQYR